MMSRYTQHQLKVPNLKSLAAAIELSAFSFEHLAMSCKGAKR